MRLDDFTYTLPPELIARYPLQKRDHSRMMIVERRTGTLVHARFLDLPEMLRSGDVLVVNDSKVIPACLPGRKETGGTVEILLLEKREASSATSETWEVLLKRAKRLRPGMRIAFSAPGEAVIEKQITDKKWLVTFTAPDGFPTFLENVGRPPLPPYIKRDSDEEDATTYQTVYARAPGSIAAPTAGLHFTDRILAQISDMNIPVAAVTLHIGYGTFSPIVASTVERHVMDEEYFELREEAAALINGAGRVIAVGTTATRVLETCCNEEGTVTPSISRTCLFIYPGFHFRRVDVLLTNFHLPRSSLYLLVCAFAGRELMARAYAEAVAREYRFYSYGDCMLII
jgi:S-adenosylmethionine:tRNA ribosyltransferase-isomerase